MRSLSLPCVWLALRGFWHCPLSGCGLSLAAQANDSRARCKSLLALLNDPLLNLKPHLSISKLPCPVSLTRGQIEIVLATWSFVRQFWADARAYHQVRGYLEITAIGQLPPVVTASDFKASQLPWGVVSSPNGGATHEYNHVNRQSGPERAYVASTPARFWA